MPELVGHTIRLNTIRLRHYENTDAQPCSYMNTALQHLSVAMKVKHSNGISVAMPEATMNPLYFFKEK